MQFPSSRNFRLQLHHLCARGAQVSTALAPPMIPPPALWPSYILPPSPLLLAPPCHLVLFTQSRTHIDGIPPPPLLVAFHGTKTG